MKNTKKILSLVFTFVMAFSVCLIAVPEQEVQAASDYYSVNNSIQTYGSKKLFVGDKIGKYYFWSQYNYSTQKLTLYRATNINSPKVVKSVSCSDSNANIYTGIVTNGTTVLFSMYTGSKTYVYKTTTSGATPVLKATLSGHCWLKGYFGDQLYYGKGSSFSSTTQNALCRYNFNTKKSYTVKSNFNPVSSYGRYIAGIIYNSSTSKYTLKLFNVNSKKTYGIAGPMAEFPSVAVTAGKVLYVSRKFTQGASRYTGTHTYYVMKSSLDGKSKTTIWKKSYEYSGMGTYGWSAWVTRSCAYADYFSGSMMYMSDKVYKINYSTKKDSLIIDYHS